MEYNFDSIVDRSNTGSLKWNKYKQRNIIPLWVADMDFLTAPKIMDALRSRLDHGIWGYTKPYQEAIDSVINYHQEHHSYSIEPQWLLWLHGTVPGINVAVRAFGSPGDSVLTCTPAYPPFLSAPPWQGRELITSDLKLEGEQWNFDFDDLERKVKPNTRLFILCSPHNPVARVFSRDELEQLCNFCLKHDLVILSDEIHSGLLFDGLKHTVTAGISEAIEDRTITLMSPSKTFNLPGLGCAYAVIKNPQLRAAFQRAALGFITEVTPMGFTGCVAAYTQGEPWRLALVNYLQGNRDCLMKFLDEKIPEIVLQPMQATYLAWLNITALHKLGIENPHSFFENAGVGLSAGTDFGDKNYLRLNFGCPRTVLRKALKRMEKAVAEKRQ